MLDFTLVQNCAVGISIILQTINSEIKELQYFYKLSIQTGLIRKIYYKIPWKYFTKPAVVIVKINSGWTASKR